MYYVNEFNIPNTDRWYYSIWKIKRISEDTGRYLPEYEWIKAIYDPMNQFKIGHILDPSPATIKSNEHKVILRIFEGI